MEDDVNNADEDQSRFKEDTDDTYEDNSTDQGDFYHSQFKEDQDEDDQDKDSSNQEDS